MDSRVKNLKSTLKRLSVQKAYDSINYLDQLWKAISQRTVNGRYAQSGRKNPKNASHYAHGIRIFDEWRDDKDAFITWIRENIGERPKDLDGDWLSLDRVDNELGYEPGNLRWATALEQAENKGRAQVMKDAGYIEGYYGGTESF